MTDILPLAHLRQPLVRGTDGIEWGRLLVAVIYGAVLVAAPMIVRYAPAPSAAPAVATAATLAPMAACPAAHAPACAAPR